MKCFILFQASNQYVTQQPTASSFVVATTPTITAKNNTVASSFYPENSTVMTTQNIRLPTVPVPSTSVFSGLSQPQQQQTVTSANTQNYLFTTTLPQQSAFNMSVVHTNNASELINRIPMSTPVSNTDVLQQYLNIPK